MANNIRIRATVDDQASRPAKGLKGLLTDLKAGAKDSILTGVGMGAGISAFNLMSNAVGAVTDAFALGVSEAIEAEAAMAQTQARLRSTGGAANVTASEVANLAQKVQDLSGMDAEAVQAGQNLLLTFTNVRNEVGRGNDIFSRATETMADMSVALGMDMSSAAVMLGKALNDPVAGVTALRKAGVQLTAEQRDQIKAFVEANDILSAQKIILAELETQVGQSAEAFGDTMAGKIEKAKRKWEDFTSSIVVGLFDAQTTFAQINQLVDENTIDWSDLWDPDGAKEAVDAAADMSVETWNENAGAIAEATRSAGQTSIQAWHDEMEKLPQAIRDRFAPIRGAAFQTQVEYAKGLQDAQDQPRVQMEALQQMQTEVLTEASEEARLLGQLNGATLAAGLADSRPAVRAQAEATRLAIINRLADLGVLADRWGASIASELAGGLNRGYGIVRDAAGNLASAVRGQIGIESEPKDPSSPLRGITKWGKNIAGELAGGMNAGQAGVRGAASGLAGGAAVAGGGSGGPTTIQLVVDGNVLAEVVDRHLSYSQPRAGVLPRA